ncbi:MAG: FAD-binding protein [Candidatus Hydrogenedentes bacterium]|nr:FAD-binding protein [Candidatus Hydrogenedentota bacterium]
MNWHEYVAETGTLPLWPYEINYGRENIIETDVLVVGGGVAGCRAAISALQHGATVAVADRGFTKHSGQGGVGVDHWHGAVRNPCSKITPEMYSEKAMELAGGYTNGLARYIIGMEGWDTLLELESWGVQIRDEDDEFEGTIWRDEETKLLFAYDVDNKHCLRIYGNNIKPVVDREMRRLGAQVYERICITSLLTEKGEKNARVIGATGINDRTGEFYIFKAKAVVLATGGGGRLGGFAPEITASNTMSDLNLTNMGHTIAWNAGADLVCMDAVGGGGEFGYAPYSMGNSDNTYQGARVVDADGKVIPYANTRGELIVDERQIFQSSRPGENYVIGYGIGLATPMSQDYNPNGLDPSLGKKLRTGELKLPLYDDFAGMPEKSRKIIWNLMLAHEGKCRVPIFENMQKWGFDPAQDMLQYAITANERINVASSWVGLDNAPPNWRSIHGPGGLVTDWRLQASLPGLFVAGGSPLFGSGCHGEAHTTGRYCGRQAAAFAKRHEQVEPSRKQIESEKEECYAPVMNKGGDIGWKELNYAIARVFQDYCGEFKTEDILNLGIKRMRDLRQAEGKRTYASNPHELARLVECFRMMDLSECCFHAAKARKCSSRLIGFGFFRADYPEVDPPEWHKLLPSRKTENDVEVRALPCDYHKQAPYSDSLRENYTRYAELD